MGHNIIDIVVRRLPTPIITTTAATVVLLLATGAVLTRRPAFLVVPVLAAVILGGGHLLLAALGASGVGMGDARLAARTGELLGTAGWHTVLSGAIIPYLLAAPFAIAVHLRHGSAAHPAHVPFGPFLVSGTRLAALIAPAVHPSAGQLWCCLGVGCWPASCPPAVTRSTSCGHFFGPVAVAVAVQDTAVGRTVAQIAAVADDVVWARIGGKMRQPAGTFSLSLRPEDELFVLRDVEYDTTVSTRDAIGEAHRRIAGSTGQEIYIKVAQDSLLGLTRFDGHPRSGAGRLREDVQHHGEHG
jgi:hypothetical protein